MKILCVAKNYPAHAAEMGGPTPPEPVWFWKPESCIIHNGDAIEIPAGIGEVHHEVELALRISKRARDVDASNALDHVDAFTVANDCTARKLQQEAKDGGKPWAQAKGFDTFLPLGAWLPIVGVDVNDLELQLTIGDKVCQRANTRQMSWDPATLIARASEWTTLEPGDILLTGTPAGVGPMQIGERVVCEIIDHVTLENPVAART